MLINKKFYNLIKRLAEITLNKRKYFSLKYKGLKLKQYV